MTFTCTAKKEKQSIIECGLSEKERDSFIKKYNAVGFLTFYNVEVRAFDITAIDLLDFHLEHTDTTIELDLSYVNTWLNNRKQKT